MRKLLIATTVLALGMGFAQNIILPAPPPGGQTGITNDMRKKMQAYRPVFDLTASVRMMSELDVQKGLAFTKAQAQKLLPILKDLGARADLKPADADKILGNIENNILSDAQVQWMDTTRLQREEQMRQRAQQQGREQQGQASALRMPGGPPLGAFGGGQRDGQGGFFQAIQDGKPFNPFKEGRAKESLDALVALMTKRAA
ncbi:MAG: hypothetical protein C4332_09090 [Meiothermus sp.]